MVIITFNFFDLSDRKNRQPLTCQLILFLWGFLK